jgi:hypothetical protein
LLVAWSTACAAMPKPVAPPVSTQEERALNCAQDRVIVQDAMLLSTCAEEKQAMR